MMLHRTPKILASLFVVGVLAGAATWATHSAFSHTTANSGNSFAVGTVEIGDNDAGAMMYDVTGRKPGDNVTTCVKVTYTGTLAATVRLYASPVGAVGAYIDLTVTPGTGSPAFPGCTGFTPDAGGAVYTGTLKGFADTHVDYTTGLTDYPGDVATSWATNDAVVYRFELTVRDDNAANGVSSPLSTGAHSFTWEAQNQ